MMTRSKNFAIVYDLRDPDAWEAARRHRNYWGKLYSDIHTLDAEHVVIVFHPAPDKRTRSHGSRLRS
jgi:hypothetical protein